LTFNRTLLLGHINKLSEEADAVIIAKFRAEHAGDFAKKMAKVADALAKLQMV
jgi:hypothetical protein